MPDNPPFASDVLDAWREQGADRLDPVRFHYLVALQRRLPAHDGEVRRLLECRLSARIKDYADALGSHSSGIPSTTRPGPRPRGELGELVDDLTRFSRQRNAGDIGQDNASRPALPELDALEHFRKTWDSARTDRQVRDSLACPQADAGPLNSARLIYRALDFMREASPDYLQQFVSYVEVLSWLEQMDHDGALKTVTKRQSVPRKARARKAPRSTRS